jgi:hypothetical protein
VNTCKVIAHFEYNRAIFDEDVTLTAEVSDLPVAECFAVEETDLAPALTSRWNYRGKQQKYYTRDLPAGRQGAKLTEQHTRQGRLLFNNAVFLHKSSPDIEITLNKTVSKHKLSIVYPGRPIFGSTSAKKYQTRRGCLTIRLLQANTCRGAGIRRQD